MAFCQHQRQRDQCASLGTHKGVVSVCFYFQLIMGVNFFKPKL